MATLMAWFIVTVVPVKLETVVFAGTPTPVTAMPAATPVVAANVAVAVAVAKVVAMAGLLVTFQLPFAAVGN
jgi:hypothetical protein